MSKLLLCDACSSPQYELYLRLWLACLHGEKNRNYPQIALRMRSMQIQKILNSTLDAVKVKDFSLVHVRFGFDRTRMQRMHAALQSALECINFKMLPPDTPSNPSHLKVLL